MLKRFLALFLALAMFFSFAACGENAEKEKNTTTTTTTNASVDVDATVKGNEDASVEDTTREEESVTAENGETTTADAKETTTKKGDKVTTTKKGDKTTTTKKADDKTTTQKVTTTEKTESNPTTKAEIIDYYNKAVNKVKTSAKSVTQTYDNSTNYNKIVEAGPLSSIGKFLMNLFLKEKEMNEKFSTKADIIAHFPVEGQKTSNVNEASVKDAKCVDKGTYYEITLVANCSDSKPDINPPRGGGIVGRMFNILEPKDITDAAGKYIDISNIKFSYMGGNLTARIDKATGNMTYLYTKLPMVLSLDAVGMKDAKVGLQFENKWKIEW